MPRDIPDRMPDAIRDLIYGTWGDVASFARACGLKYEQFDIKYATVLSVLTRQQHRAIGMIERIAESLTDDEEQIVELMDRIAQIMIENQPVERKELIRHLARDFSIYSLSELARTCNATPQVLNDFLTSESIQIRNLFVVVQTLGLPLRRFGSVYKEQLAKVS